MNIFIEPDKNFTKEVKYILTVLAQNKNTTFTFVDQVEHSDLSFGSTSSCDFIIAESFYDSLNKGQFQYKYFFEGDCFIKTNSGKDYVSTAFYMINSFQEYNSSDLDEIGRFKYSTSYQSTYGNITINLVQKCFDRICEHPKLIHLKAFKNQSSFYLSHDIDSIHGSLLQDGFYLLKKGKPHLVFNLLTNVLLQRPDWFTMDKIMAIEDEYSFKSTFFWLVNKGRINQREVNSDYNINSRLLDATIKKIKLAGWYNGLHKSISPDSFAEEIRKSGFHPDINRNHYLKFRLPDFYETIEASGLKMDASLGFAAAFGFRNSYGLPFTPYNLKERKPFSFVETPLTIMDTTLHKYLNVPPETAAGYIIEFLERNKHDCVISLLWHNNYFTDYKFHGYLRLYKILLAYLYENKWPCISPDEITRKFLIHDQQT